MYSVKYPPFVHWEVTPNCNHNCIHCYNYWRKESECFEASNMNLSEQHYLDVAKKLIEHKAHTVVVTGGEPLLVFDKIKNAISLLKDNGINVSINTNAVLISEEVIDFVLKHKISLFISFPYHKESICDFITNRAGSLKRILSSLDRLTERNARFSLNIVASKANIDCLEETVDFLRERYNIKKIYITRVGKPINSDMSFDQYLLSYDDLCKVQDICVKAKYEYGIEVDTGCPYALCSINSQKAFELFAYRKVCTAGKTSYAMDSFGNLKACPRDSKIYGNVFEESIDVILERMSEWRDGSLLPVECNSCNMKEVCRGACRVDAFPFTGTLNSLDRTARLENLPIRYLKNSNSVDYNDNDFFIVNPLKTVKEDFGYRISYQASYVFVTEELMNFLVRYPKFNLKDIMTSFSVNKLTANNIIARLIKNGIVHLERRWIVWTTWIVFSSMFIILVDAHMMIAMIVIVTVVMAVVIANVVIATGVNWFRCFSLKKLLRHELFYSCLNFI